MLPAIPFPPIGLIVPPWLPFVKDGESEGGGPISSAEQLIENIRDAAEPDPSEMRDRYENDPGFKDTVDRANAGDDEAEKGLDRITRGDDDKRQDLRKLRDWLLNPIAQADDKFLKSLADKLDEGVGLTRDEALRARTIMGVDTLESVFDEFPPEQPGLEEMGNREVSNEPLNLPGTSPIAGNIPTLPTIGNPLGNLSPANIARLGVGGAAAIGGLVGGGGGGGGGSLGSLSGSENPDFTALTLEQMRLQNDVLRQQLSQNTFQQDFINRTLADLERQETRARQEFEGILAENRRMEQGRIARESETEERFRKLLEPSAEEEELAELERQIAKESGERTLKGLRGELPLDPALERDIEKGRLELHEKLRSQLGPGFEISTPGIEALGDFDERANILRDAARRGQLTALEGIGQTRTAASLSRTAQGATMTESFGRLPTTLSNFASLMPMLPASVTGRGGLMGVNIPLAQVLGQQIATQTQANTASQNIMSQLQIARAQQQQASATGRMNLIGTLGAAALAGLIPKIFGP